jgi:hypothetical protein
MAPRELQALLGGTDIYLLDQILRGNFAPGMKIFDAGCGGGRGSISPATRRNSQRCLGGSWRPLRPGGLFCCRLASTIGMPERHLAATANGARGNPRAQDPSPKHAAEIREPRMRRQNTSRKSASLDRTANSRRGNPRALIALQTPIAEIRGP